MLGVGVEPAFGIGQRALCTGGLLWDCIAVLDDAATRRLIDAGGVDTIAISHPHYYTGMADLAERLDARILLHEADRQWITRPTDRIELWSGDHHVLGPDLELVRLGGHFDGGTICLWRGGAEGRGALLTGDIVQVVADHDRVSFMYSFPCFIPLPAREILRIRDVLAGLVFDRVHGAWWGASVQDDAKAKVLRSADRYLAALR
ncbi:MBL fold metallo-hydrolase [Baekduia soli]|uniref:MBL fold metallo-hydrolase n=1 Tax=Baekduia soli TaxID=496014 RepID=UPI003898D93F